MWSITAITNEHRDALQQWKMNVNLDFWDHLSKTDKPCRIMVAPAAQSDFQTFLQNASIVNEIIIANVEK